MALPLLNHLCIESMSDEPLVDLLRGFRYPELISLSMPETTMGGGFQDVFGELFNDAFVLSSMM